MRRVSPRRAAFNREAEPYRQAMKERIARCEYCLHPCSAKYLTLHEIARGPCRRAARPGGPEHHAGASEGPAGPLVAALAAGRLRSALMGRRIRGR